MQLRIGDARSNGRLGFALLRVCELIAHRSETVPGRALQGADAFAHLTAMDGRSRTSDRHGWRECRRIAGAIPAMCFATPAHLTAMDGRSRTSCASRHLHLHVQWRECKRIAGAILAMCNGRSRTSLCFAAPAHPCAMGVHKIARVAGLRKRFWGSPQRRRARSGAVAVGVVIDSQTLSPTYSSFHFGQDRTYGASMP